VLLTIVAVVVIAAMVALLVWAAPLATNGVEAQDAGAGSAVIHDDAGNVNSYSYPLPPGKGASRRRGHSVPLALAGEVRGPGATY
jgi:hypothetical protein